ncbi:MAG: hypothetical protein V4638_04880 [Bacteroidota bacterium]
MVKLIPFLYFFFLTASFAQTLDGKILLGDHWMHFEVIDSTITIEEDVSYEGFDLKFFSQHMKIVNPNGNKIQLNLYRDSVLFYQEFDSSGLYITCGEMKPKQDLLYFKTEKMLGEDGEFDYIDTLFYFSKHGIWTKVLSPEISQISSFYQGEKTDEYVEIHPWCNELSTVKVLPKNYIIDSTNWSIDFELPNHKKLENLLVGHWYNPECIHYYKRRDNPFWVYSRTKPQFPPHEGPIECEFSSTGMYEGRFGFSCGVGVTKDDYNPHRNWKLNKQKQLVLGDGLYKIIYVDENSLFFQEIISPN